MTRRFQGSLQRVEGPECPRCGCEDTELLEEVTRWGKRSERRQCNHCGKVFYADLPPEEDGDEANVAIRATQARCFAPSRRNLDTVGRDGHNARVGTWQFPTWKTESVAFVARCTLPGAVPVGGRPFGRHGP